MNKETAQLNFESATHRLVLLHGWGADAQDLMPLAQEIINTDKFVLDIASLNAPHLHPQGFGRMWYPLFPPDWESIPKAVNELAFRIKALATDQIPLGKTIVLGFSQGGAMALEMGSNLPVCGIIACSSYSHPNWSPHTNMPPILLTHGINDEIIPLGSSEKTIDLLDKYDLDVDMSTFSGGHEITEELIKQFQLKIKSWLY